MVLLPRKFHLLASSSSASAPAFTKLDDEQSAPPPVKGGYNNNNNSSSSSSYPEKEGPKTPIKPAVTNDSQPSSSGNKKRSRRRRKGKSRSKVEPLESSVSPQKRGGGCGSSTAASHCSSVNSKKQHDAPMTKRDIYFALDCEMVGVGPDGLSSAVGRVSIVNWENQTVLDTYVQVPVPVTDYRTHVSGITAEHLIPNPNNKQQQLMTFPEVQILVQDILRGKILIGHGLENDLKALNLYHPWSDIRDTATYSYFMREHWDPNTQEVTMVPKKLRDLTWEILGRQIQTPGAPHSPTEDAIAALDLYKQVRAQWEDHLIKLMQEQEKKQQQQLMEQRAQQLLLERQRQYQHQQQQARRWQWLASNCSTGEAAVGVEHPFAEMAHPVMQSHPPLYTSGVAAAPIMMMVPPGSSVTAYLQQSSLEPPQQSSRTSSWFGLSRRRSRGAPQQQQQEAQQPQTSPRAFDRQESHDSTTTQCTVSMTQASFDSRGYDMMVQTTFSQDAEGFPSSPTGAWHVRNGFGFEEEIDVDQINKTCEEEEDGAKILDTLRPALSTDESVSEIYTETTVTLSSDADKLFDPTVYVPPRYYASPDPQERFSSSSWFKLFSSSSRNKQPKEYASKSCGYNSDADADVDEKSAKSEKSSRRMRRSLFSRRASEGFMCDDEEFMQQAKDQRSRSLHG